MRKFVRMLFSIIGMTALVAGYSIGGGFLFSFLETGQEQAMRHNVIVVSVLLAAGDGDGGGGGGGG